MKEERRVWVSFLSVAQLLLALKMPIGKYGRTEREEA